MRIECDMNATRLVPETEVEAYYLRQFENGQVELSFDDAEAERPKPTHADEEPEEPEIEQTITLNIWP